MGEVYPFPESSSETPAVSSSDPIDFRWAIGFPTWHEFRMSLQRSREFNRVEELMICHLTKAFDIDRSVIDEILYDPGQFRNLRIVCDDPETGAPMTVTDAAEYASVLRAARHRREGGMNYWLYHIYGENDRLLYVGITRNPTGREKAHRRRWGNVIERIEYEQFDSHEEVLAEERREIAIHNPPFNCEHVGAQV